MRQLVERHDRLPSRAVTIERQVFEPVSWDTPSGDARKETAEVRLLPLVGELPAYPSLVLLEQFEDRLRDGVGLGEHGGAGLQEDLVFGEGDHLE
jgi:hypothetical protein